MLRRRTTDCLPEHRGARAARDAVGHDSEASSGVVPKRTLLMLSSPRLSELTARTFLQQRQTQKRAARDREPSASEYPSVQTPYDDSPFCLRLPHLPALSLAPDSCHPCEPDEATIATESRTSARAGIHFPLVNSPRRQTTLPPPPYPELEPRWHRGASSTCQWPGPALAPMSQDSSHEQNVAAQQGIFSKEPGQSMDLDAESIRTVSSGSSRRGRSTSSGPTPRLNGSLTLPPLSSVLGSSHSQFSNSTSAAKSDFDAVLSPSLRSSVSSQSSSRPSIAPTASSHHYVPNFTPSVRTGGSHSSLAPPQSIFQHPGHRSRPLSDLLTLPKFLRIGSSPSAPPSRVSSTSILDAALASSANWPRQARPHHGTRSVDVLDAAMSSRVGVSATSAMQYRHDQRESREGMAFESPMARSSDERAPRDASKTAHYPAVIHGSGDT